MGIIERYIFWQTLKGTVLTLVTLTTLVWTTQALIQLNLLTTKGQSAGTFLAVTVLLLPFFISIILPISLFVASIFTLNRLNADSELVVINAAGSSRWRTISPFIYLAFICALAVGYINLEVVPRSKEKIGDMLAKVQLDLIATVIREGKFKSTDDNMTFHVRERSQNGELLGLLVHDARNPQETMTYIAERGRLVEDSGRNYLIMENGMFQRQSGNVQQTQIVKFTRYNFDLSQFESASREVSLRPSQRTTSYLLNPDEDDSYYVNSPGTILQELHFRFSSPIYPFMLVMIALATVGFARTNRQNRTWATGMAIFTGLMTRVAGFAFHNMSSNSMVGLVLVYAWPLLVTFIAGLIAFGLFRPDKVPWMVSMGQQIKNAVNTYWQFNLNIINRLLGLRHRGSVTR
ncbi:MAG: LPS export ABC transporter permease LptF [Fimbriimonadaceae bacterium]|nr:LPS export ABC transporter permease LptF [Alphaproteobacteria bacterium]